MTYAPDVGVSNLFPPHCHKDHVWAPVKCRHGGMILRAQALLGEAATKREERGGEEAVEVVPNGRRQVTVSQLNPKT